MRISPLEISLSSLSPARERSSCAHFSDILHPLLVDIEPDRFGRPGGIDLAQASVGFMWEEVLGKARAGIARGRRSELLQTEIEYEIEVRVGGKVILVPVIFTPDAISFERGLGAVVEEYKATWISATNSITSGKFWHWHVQVKAYCKVVGTRRARIYVLFVDGDYHPKRRIPRAWEIEYSRLEIEENWGMVRRKLETLVEKGEWKWTTEK